MFPNPRKNNLVTIFSQEHVLEPKKHVLLSFCGQFSVMACNQYYPTNIENSSTQYTILIGYFPIVLMKLFELYMFELDINTNCRHL